MQVEDDLKLPAFAIVILAIIMLFGIYMFVSAPEPYCVYDPSCEQTICYRTIEYGNLTANVSINMSNDCELSRGG